MGCGLSDGYRRFAIPTFAFGAVFGAASTADAYCAAGQRCIVEPNRQFVPQYQLRPQMPRYMPNGQRQGMPEFRNGLVAGRQGIPEYRGARWDNGRIIPGYGTRFYTTTQWYFVPSGVGNSGPPFDIEEFVQSLAPDGSMAPGEPDGSAPQEGSE